MKVKTLCYDRGPERMDRYTVIYADFPGDRPGLFACLGMSDMPNHPQGFCQHGEAVPGKHLGRRVALSTLPAACQVMVARDLAVIESDQLYLSR